ncbi:MAG: hypothetical protein FJW54_06115 [Actinobacteria bacterium]|nr:hypothetical protein [Actinomycetota bacterium]
MTNVRLIGYTSLAVGLINWRYIDFNAGSFAIIVGVLVLLAAFFKPLQPKMAKGPGFILIAVLAALAVVYSLLA